MLVYIDLEKFVCLLFCFIFIKVLCLETQVKDQILVWMDDLPSEFYQFLHHQENLEFRVAWLILFLWPWKERGWGNFHLLIYEFIQQQKLPDLSLLVWREIRTCWVSVSVLCCCVQNSLILPSENSLTPSQTVDYNGHN